jgi:hypothetical protein
MKSLSNPQVYYSRRKALQKYLGLSEEQQYKIFFYYDSRILWYNNKFFTVISKEEGLVTHPNHTPFPAEFSLLSPNWRYNGQVDGYHLFTWQE